MKESNSQLVFCEISDQKDKHISSYFLCNQCVISIILVFCKRQLIYPGVKAVHESVLISILSIK